MSCAQPGAIARTPIVPLKEDNFYWLEVGRGWGDLSSNVPPPSLAPSVLPSLLDYFHLRRNRL